MLQGFRIDVAKVDRDIAYVAMAIYICCKRLCQMFYLFSNVCCQRFYLDVAYMSHVCLQVFLSGCCICFAMANKYF
jgi:hypothetical protein